MPARSLAFTESLSSSFRRGESCAACIALIEGLRNCARLEARHGGGKDEINSAAMLAQSDRRLLFVIAFTSKGG